MKYCSKCGAEVEDNANFCPKCGNQLNPAEPQAVESAKVKNNELASIAEVFMIIGTIIRGFFLFPLCWCIPMTVHYYKVIDRKSQPSIAFKICSLIFVSLIGGILMLVDFDN